MKNWIKISSKLERLDSKEFLERSLGNSVSRYWQTLPKKIKSIIYGENQNTNDMITRSPELIRLEFVGGESYFKDANSGQKYTNALFKLTFYDMCKIDKYIWFLRLLL